MTPTRKRAGFSWAEILFVTFAGVLSIYLGEVLFSAFEPSLISGAMRELRIFLGAIISVFGAIIVFLGAQAVTGKPHAALRIGVLILLVLPFTYVGVKLLLATISSG